ncbi:MAG: bifunctional UDP-N-acetylglucosamine diphosphorylase/glucosamine-1-phosphate N-acetyltransferase GlmU [Butyricicoccus sp.]|nr:bifunctional UDP-N-acetylglucosamine diphosphorylase/glucosamine-1-phosphate N-acetyltransferase GlmU [Butyricicoccus sp.]
MSHITTIFLNGVAGSDGMDAFARPVLFADAAAWMADALPCESFGEAALLCPLGETPFAAEADALHAVSIPADAEQVLLIAAPMPELEAGDFAHAAALHQATGSAVTLLCCDGAAAGQAVLRDENAQVRGVGHGNGPKALHAAFFRADVLKSVLPEAQSLFDAVAKAAAQGALCDACPVPAVIEVTDGMTAYQAQKNLTLRINLAHIAAGVQIFAPENTFIAPDAVIGAGASILPGCLIRPGCKVGAGAVIGPNTILEQAEIGAGTSVNNSQVYESTVGAQATVGPFAYIRPGCTVGDNTRIGDFVELKKAHIGNGTKVSHLTYIGDAEVGERVNFGCGTVVVNYDGYVKSKTVIGDDCFIGCNTNLVAPVTLGDRVFTAAGTTVTKNVPDGALTVARARQTNIEGWNDRRRAAHQK